MQTLWSSPLESRLFQNSSHLMSGTASSGFAIQDDASSYRARELRNSRPEIPVHEFCSAAS